MLMHLPMLFSFLSAEEEEEEEGKKRRTTTSTAEAELREETGALHGDWNHSAKFQTKNRMV